MYKVNLGEECDALVEHLAEKAIARAQTGDRNFELEVSSERHEKYRGQLKIALDAAGVN